MSSMVAIVKAAVAGGKSDWVAHASGVLVSASRRNKLHFKISCFRAASGRQKVRDREDALASTRDACATQNPRLRC
jgi:hypothetical protein